MSEDIFIRFPFAIDSDALTPFPMSADPDGAVSFEDGYTPPYQQNLNTTPGALAINRGQMNYLFYVLSLASKQYQEVGTPNWIDSTANGGTPFPYQIYARVIYGNVIYESRENANTSTPGADAKWVIISGNNAGVPVGCVIDMYGPTAPTGYIECDGSAVDRTLYSDLFAYVTSFQSGAVVTSGDTTITGLSTTKLRPGMPMEGMGIDAASVIIDVVNSTTVQMSIAATASSTSGVRFFYTGLGNGTTTFNVPNIQGYVTAGAGGAGLTFGSVTQNVAGGKVGDQNYQIVKNNLPEHDHNSSSSTLNFLGQSLVGGEENTSPTGGNLGRTSGTGGVAGGTTNAPMPLIQPTVIVTKCIKY